MQKINFQNLPNTTTPVSAGNLNQLQTNVENAINGIITTGNWTPVINTLEGALPTITYTNRRGGYVRVGDMVFIQFYIRGKITALSGTNNYGLITGLPFFPVSLALGETPLDCSMYSLTDNWVDGTTLNVYRDSVGGTPMATIRIMDISGSSTRKLIITSTSYFEIGGSGWYRIDTSV